MNKELIERIAPEVAGEPAGEMVGHHSVGIGEMPTFRWRNGYRPTVGTKFYTDPPKCPRCAELEALENVSLNIRQMKRIAELQAKLAAAEKVMEQAESIVSMAVKTMRAAHVHRAEIYDMTEEFLKAIAAYKKETI